ncbi:hypothetical protein SAMN05444397_101813 [Flavobacterium aquidurense]|nr:hypothetical protein [Flavobacterium frigidimaris]SDY50902.1 hypothetical protein SAMN05444397_101813 [Flavobacterium aquidurense]
MNISYHKNNVENSSRTSAKKTEVKSTSARSNEKSSIETRKSVQMNK